MEAFFFISNNNIQFIIYFCFQKYKLLWKPVKNIKEEKWVGKKWIIFILEKNIFTDIDKILQYYILKINISNVTNIKDNVFALYYIVSVILKYYII